MESTNNSDISTINHIINTLHIAENCDSSSSTSVTSTTSPPTTTLPFTTKPSLPEANCNPPEANCNPPEAICDPPEAICDPPEANCYSSGFDADNFSEEKNNISNVNTDEHWHEINFTIPNVDSDLSKPHVVSTMTNIRECECCKKKEINFSVPNLNTGVLNEIYTKEDFLKILVEANDMLVFVDFTAKWCGPCKRITPDIIKLAEKYKNILFLKVDVDNNEETSMFCKINCMPTFLFYKNNELIDYIEGADLVEITNLINKYNK